MSPGRQGGSVPFPTNASGPTLQAPVLTLGIVTDVASMSAALPVNSLPCIAPQSSNWEVYSSTYYQGDPTAQPGQWTGPESPDGDGPVNADWTEMPSGSYFICRCKTSAGWSPWSNVIPTLTGVVVTQQTNAINFTYAGTEPVEWDLYVFFSKETWLSANQTTASSISDDYVFCAGGGRSLDVSKEGGQFYFILCAQSLINGVDVEAARGQYTVS